MEASPTFLTTSWAHIKGWTEGTYQEVQEVDRLCYPPFLDKSSSHIKPHTGAFKRIQIIQWPHTVGSHSTAGLLALSSRIGIKELNYVLKEPSLVTFKTAQRIWEGSEA